MTLEERFSVSAALAAPTLGAALSIREAQWQAAPDWAGTLPPFDQGRAHAVWLDGNATVLAHWGQVAHAGLTDDPAVLALPNPARAVPA
jgi:hypothetical protein